MPNEMVQVVAAKPPADTPTTAITLPSTQSTSDSPVSKTLKGRERAFVRETLKAFDPLGGVQCRKLHKKNPQSSPQACICAVFVAA